MANKIKTYKDRKHKPTVHVSVGKGTFIGKNAKRAKYLLASQEDWDRGEGAQTAHAYQKPGSLKCR